MPTTFTRRSAVGLIAGAALAPLAPARAGRVLDLRAGGFQPINIAVTNFAGDDAARTVTSVVTNNFKRSVFLKPVDAAAPAREPRQSRRHAQSRRLSQRQRAIRADRPLAARRRRAAEDRVPPVRRDDRRTGRGTTIRHRRRQHAPRRASSVGRGVHPLTGEKGFFDTRIVFVDETGPKEQPAQAPRHHGPGRRQSALPDARRRTRGDAALLALVAGRDLYVLRRRRRSQGAAAQHRKRPARGCRQFSRHDLFAAVLARWAEDRHVAQPRRGDQSLYDGYSLAHDDAAHRTPAPSTPRPAIRRTGAGSCSNPIAAARSRFTS